MKPEALEALEALAAEVLDACERHGLKLATAESCTGGLVAAFLTAVAGSSRVVERGFVTYSNDAKHELLAVANETIAAWGAVSEPVACAMAEGALAASRADVTLAVTGIAGPGGATSEKPVGLVHMACARKGFPTRHQRRVFGGSRSDVRTQAVETALRMVLERLADEDSAVARLRQAAGSAP